MEGRYTKLVVIAATLALVLGWANAYDNPDLMTGFNFCNLNGNSIKACSHPVNNNPTPECCGAVKGVDPKCVCVLITSISSNRDQAKKTIAQCGINVANC